MLMKYPRTLCLAAVWPGSIWKYFEATVSLTALSGRLKYSLETIVHFADKEAMESVINSLLHLSRHPTNIF